MSEKEAAHAEALHLTKSEHFEAMSKKDAAHAQAISSYEAKHTEAVKSSNYYEKSALTQEEAIRKGRIAADKLRNSHVEELEALQVKAETALKNQVSCPANVKV